MEIPCFPRCSKSRSTNEIASLKSRRQSDEPNSQNMRKPNLTKWLMMAAISLSFGLASRSFAQNLLVNGDFELTNLPTGSNGGALLNGTGLPGWTLTGGDGAGMNIYQYTSAFNLGFTPIPQNGNYGVWLDGTVGTGNENFTVGPSISQSLTLDPGVYNLSFYINTEVGNISGNEKGGTSGVLVDLLGTGITNGALNHSEFTVTNPVGVSQSAAQWQLVSENFTVSNPSLITLSFFDDPNTSLANLNQSSNISVDNVSIAAIPEPSSLALMAIGAMSLFGIQFCRRRRC